MNGHPASNAILWGYAPPLFPRSLDDLLLASTEETGLDKIVEAAKTLEEYKGTSNPRTEDGYEWQIGIHFSAIDGEIAVLFPWNNNTRLAAVYIRGKVAAYEINEILVGWLMAARDNKKGGENSQRDAWLNA